MRSLRQKLLLFILPLCLIPLIGISFFSYFQAKERITEDRIALYLEQIARGLANTIRLTLLEKREATLSMGLCGGFRDYLLARTKRPPRELLNQMILVHQVYDVIVVFDVEGRIVLTSGIDRNSIDEPKPLDPDQLELIRGQPLVRYTPNDQWLRQVRAGRFGYIGWHMSKLVHQLYDYLDEDIARQYSIGFASPIMDERGLVVGGILTLMNWEFIQEILDEVEAELEHRSLRTGYAFLFAKDGDTIIAHKYRRNRNQPNPGQASPIISDNYGTSLVNDHHLGGLHKAVEQLLADPLKSEASHFKYEYPPGTAKISGLAPVDHDFFEWVCGVGIDDQDIFAPVQDLKNVLILAALFSSLLVGVLTYSVARQITTPVKKLIQGAGIIAGGDLSQRVAVSSRDEIGQLASKFNEMAEALQERSRALQELNRKLEEKVGERTRELEKSHAEVQKAYQDLKEAEVQLIQSEKMASLGQLVAGIAHEIKNPLNFIYGNTDFLKKYLSDLKRLIDLYERRPPPDAEAQSAVEVLKKEINYEFIQEDLETLIDNFDEGAKRIHSIIGDLRAFSRMESDEFRPIDIHDSIETALNLLRHEYRDRIEMHKEYGELPKVNCHAGKLSQVFMNLLANACQAIPAQGDIWIRTSTEDQHVVVEIEDNGTGIEERNLNRVFEPFFTTKPVGRGTGLGLSISYGILRQHNGSITVESRKDEGTRFRIELPVTR
ncbi:MAG: ATP-binding protein [Acidobacteriota bacterium]